MTSRGRSERKERGGILRSIFSCPKTSHKGQETRRPPDNKGKTIQRTHVFICSLPLTLSPSVSVAPAPPLVSPSHNPGKAHRRRCPNPRVDRDAAGSHGTSNNAGRGLSEGVRGRSRTRNRLGGIGRCGRRGGVDGDGGHWLEELLVVWGEAYEGVLLVERGDGTRSRLRSGSRCLREAC